MLIKLIGSIIVLFSCGLAGFTLSRDTAKRPGELREMQGILQMLENEIIYMSNFLEEAFENIVQRSNSSMKTFFNDTLVIIHSDKCRGFQQAWEQSLNNNIGKTALKREDLSILKDFGKMLGRSDAEGQMKNIKLTINLLDVQRHKAEEKRIKNEAMYRKLGVLMGIAVIIIFI